jgi:hypothetical protein
MARSVVSAAAVAKANGKWERNSYITKGDLGQCSNSYMGVEDVKYVG